VRQAEPLSSVAQSTAFLVGDAAHRVTPRGGTGLNTAIHDGYDLRVAVVGHDRPPR